MSKRYQVVGVRTFLFEDRDRRYRPVEVDPETGDEIKWLRPSGECTQQKVVYETDSKEQATTWLDRQSIDRPRNRSMMVTVKGREYQVAVWQRYRRSSPLYEYNDALILDTYTDEVLL